MSTPAERIVKPWEIYLLASLIFLAGGAVGYIVHWIQSLRAGIL